METVHAGAALFLLLNLLAGLIRVVRGPTLADRMIVAQLLGTTSVATLLLLATEAGRAPLRDVALLFALLSLISTVAFIRLAPYRPKEPGP